MTAYLLRRNGWGEDSCKYIQEEYDDLKIVNKDKDQFPTGAKWCIRWGTTSSIPNSDSVKVINKASAIHKVFNKGYFRKEMADAGLAPATVVNIIPDDSSDIYPAVVRPMNHSASQELYLASNKAEATEAVKEIKKELGDDYNGFYLSKFIDKEREIRVFVVSGRVVAVLEKIPSKKIRDEDVSWGVGEANWKYVNWNHWPISCVKVASEAFKLSGLDFGAVDIIMIGNNAYCLEINTAPQLSPYYAGQFAKGLRYIIEKDKRDFIPPAAANNYQSYIHPALI